MGYATRHLNRRTGDRSLDLARLSEALRAAHPALDFALVLGSAGGGVLKPGADVDLALHVSDPQAGRDALVAAVRAAEQVCPEVTCDAGLLNRADPVYRFEALKGRLLFVRDRAAYEAFFSLTCREYESQMADYERQLRYRREARSCATTG